VARKLRVEFGGACYHVVNRGNYRRDVFGSKGAAESFSHCLDETCVRFGWQMHAFVIMRNHFHLAVETPEPNLSEGMKWLQGTWTMRFNRLRAECGRPFQGRFKAWHVEPGGALAQVAHYIHLNPLSAGIVTADQLLAFRPGSLRLFPARDRPVWLIPTTVLYESGGLPDTAGGWRRYCQYLLTLAAEEPRRREERFAELSRGWVIGSEGFAREMQERLAAQHSSEFDFALLGTDREGQLQARQARCEEKLRQLARAADINLNALPARKSAFEKVFLAAALKG
jgi:putative transposase